MAKIYNVPPEIKFAILQFLDVVSLLKMRRQNRQLRDFVDYMNVYKQLVSCRSDFSMNKRQWWQLFQETDKYYCLVQRILWMHAIVVALIWSTIFCLIIVRNRMK
jgi:F-box domain.